MLPRCKRERPETRTAIPRAENLRVTVNPELLRVRSGEIRLALAQLREAAANPVESLTNDANLRDATLYRLIVAIESAQAICTHLAAHLPTRAPSTVSDCFQALAERTVISPDLAGRLGQMARFRNLLVHRYWELDLARVHRILREDLGDLDAYLGAVTAFVEGHS